jgi:hypothetical protein
VKKINEQRFERPYLTYQFDDYSKYESTLFDVEAKAKRRKKRNSKDLQKAFDVGARFDNG